ncbi:MAG: RNA methyltransferase [Patescibacteria group bacterium]
MLSKNELKNYTALLQKKFRKQENKFIAEGKRFVEDGLKSQHHCEIIFVTNDFAKQNNFFIQQAKKKQTRLELVSDEDLAKLTDTQTPQGIVAIFEKKFFEIKEIYNSNLIVALENIADPGNLGTILRTCDWFGIKNVILSPDCAEIYNPKTLRASMGSIFHLNFFDQINFYAELKKLQANDFEILVADLGGADIFKYKRPKKMVLTLANEANGPSVELEKICDQKITIPQIGQAESLNVATAGAIIMAEITKN